MEDLRTSRRNRVHNESALWAHSPEESAAEKLNFLALPLGIALKNSPEESATVDGREKFSSIVGAADKFLDGIPPLSVHYGRSIREAGTLPFGSRFRNR